MDDAQLVHEIAQHLEAELRRGFCSVEEAVDAAIDLYGADDDYPGDDVVERLAQERLQRIVEEQQSWTRPTDAERLAEAFRELNAAGILARHHYAPTRTWGRGDLLEEAKHAAARGLAARGYAYYTSQDAEGLDEGCLHLAFGAFSKPGTTYASLAQATQAIAEQICERLTAAGLNVEWGGEIDETIVLYDLDWRCPRDRSTGRGVLANERIAPAQQQEPSESARTTHWPLTENDEWWVVVTFIAFDGSNAAEVALDVVWDRLRPESRRHRGPGALDFVLADVDVAEKRMRLDVIAAPANPLHGATRRSSVAAADVVVAIVRDKDADFDSVKELAAWTAGSPRKPLVVVLLDAPAALLADGLARSFSYPIQRIDFAVDASPVVTVLKQAAKHAASCIVRKQKSS